MWTWQWGIVPIHLQHCSCGWPLYEDYGPFSIEVSQGWRAQGWHCGELFAKEV